MPCDAKTILYWNYEQTKVIAQEKNYEIIIKHCVCFKNKVSSILLKKR